jgi:inner membrane protein
MDDLGSIMRHFQEQNGWFWMAAAAVLFMAEAAIPGVFLMWFGLAAAIIGLVLFMAPGMTIAWQVALFAVASAMCVAIGRQVWGSYQNPPSDKPDLNLRSNQYIGQVFELTEAIRDGRGRAAVGDGIWMVKGPEMPAGARVRVTGADGTMLVVEQA